MHDPTHSPEHPPRNSGFSYALQGDRCVHVSEVRRGRACGCRCPGCGEPVVARKGAIRVLHFAHLNHSTCLGAPESALHTAAKQVLAELDQIDLPEYRYRPYFERPTWKSLPDGGLVVPGRTVSIDRCELEVRIGTIVADAVVWRGDRPLAIEVVVTHAPQRAKVRAYRRSKHSALAIFLGRACQNYDPEDLRRKIRNDLACKRWIYHWNQHKRQLEFLAGTRAARAAKKQAVAAAIDRELGRKGSPSLSHRTVRKVPEWLKFDRWADREIARTGKAPTLEDYRKAKSR